MKSQDREEFKNPLQDWEKIEKEFPSCLDTEHPLFLIRNLCEGKDFDVDQIEQKLNSFMDILRGKFEELVK
jgi:hypothetical protein